MPFLQHFILITKPEIVSNFECRVKIGKKMAVPAIIITERFPLNPKSNHSFSTLPEYDHLLDAIVLNEQNIRVGGQTYTFDAEMEGIDWITKPSTSPSVKINIYLMKAQPTSNNSVDSAVIYAYSEWQARELLDSKFNSDPMKTISPDNGGAKFYWWSAKHVEIEHLGIANTGSQPIIHHYTSTNF